MKVKHLKTGNIYEVIYSNVFDATKALGGRKLVVYQREYESDDQLRPVFAREADEFWQKFEKEPNRCCSCGTTENLHQDGRYGYRCNSDDCIPY